jgi:hypothetical protein
MTAPVFGFLTDLRAEFLELMNNLLLVAGGFLVGYLLGGVIGWALGRWAFRQKTPDTLQRLGRPVGGVIVALIVALIVFTGKGKPTGDGGDGKGTPNTETSPGKNPAPSADPNPKVDPKITTPKIDPTPTESTIRVTILGGRAVPAEGKFYLLDDDPNSQARTLSELKRAIDERKATAKGKMILAILFPTDPNLAPPRNDQKVTDVTRWATEEAGLDVIFPATR